MTACHDPYTELELYLQKAQEEIGKAVEELQQHEESWSDSEPLLLPPPPAFRSQTLGDRSSSHRKKKLENWPHATLNRVCHDGNLLEVCTSPRQLRKNKATSYFSKIGPDIASTPREFKKASPSYSPNTRRRLWQMHPSLSFPETTRDSLQRVGKAERQLCFNQNGNLDCHNKISNGYTDGVFEEPITRKMRQRSMSESYSPPHLGYAKDDEDMDLYPRPPSGDVNLLCLSLWADKLVLEIDKSLSGEFNSASSFSPSSDYSLSPIKHDDQQRDSDCSTPKPTDCSEFRTAEQSEDGIVAAENDLKLVSPSPDSGIEQVTCETPETLEDVDSAFALQNESWERDEGERPTLICDSLFTEHEQLTPPPVEFEDEKSTYLSSVPSKRDRETQVCASQILKTANNVVEIHEPLFTLLDTKDVDRTVACSIAATTMEPEVFATVTSTCIVNEAPSKKQVEQKYFNDVSATLHRKSKHNDYAFDDFRPQYSNSHQFSSLRKPGNRKCEDWSTSLPKDAGRNSSGSFSSQRSASSSAVSSVTEVSMDELAAFMQRLKTKTCQPPQLEDVSTNIKNDESNKDAETQTTPLPLSRSSSFTWVTECDCSDWDSSNLRSESENSLLMANCSNCKTNRTENDRLSPLPVSSDEDLGEEREASACSSSSLYLSACSGSSDSFNETCPSSEVETSVATTSRMSEENPFSRHAPLVQRGVAVLANISEEHVASETTSMKSSESSYCIPSPLEQSASFPSTLKSSRRNRSGQSPAQPIEPTVLVINELNLKSVSAPVLLRHKRHANTSLPESSSSDSSPTSATRSLDTSFSQNQDTTPVRSHSAKELNELQAIEACGWLRAAGFPQYAQMYEDNQFPIDICTVQKDHAFLQADSIQSLFRRLNTLNRCAKMKYLDSVHRKSVHVEDSDEEEQCALSENWEFQRSSRRWSRIPSPSEDLSDRSPSHNHPQVSPKTSRLTLPSPARKFLSPEEAYCSSHDSVFMDEQHSSPDSIRRSTLVRHAMTPAYQQLGDCSPGSSSGSGGALEELQERSLRRSGSDRVRQGAKALLKRMESLKGKRKKKPQCAAAESALSSAMHSGTDGSSSGSLTSSPRLLRPQRQCDSFAYHSYRCNPRRKGWGGYCLGDDMGAHSDSDCPMLMFSEMWKDANSNNTKFVKHFVVPHGAIELASGQRLEPSSTYCKYIRPESQKKRTRLHPNDCSPKHDWDDSAKRSSYYDNISAPIVVFNDLCVEDLDKSNSLQDIHKAGTSAASNFYECGQAENPDDGEIIIINNDRRDSGVGSSLTRGVTYEQAPWHCFPQRRNNSAVKGLLNPVPIIDLTSPQILLVRKLSLLKLTTVMEKFSPSSRTGWSWAVPKFIRRNRSPDYKDKIVFGVPLLLVLQRTGRPLPGPIEAAIHHLKTTALDSTGLFRKSGVRSRIQRLKNLTEKDPDKINFDEQQAYDIADMLKQYFRDLPEALLTTKLSETFISIFQYIPHELRFEAVQAAVMLMPDENREVLHSLLGFLREVCGHAGINQMTATNLAVCFAPSLFHLSTPRSASSSPRRRKTVGVPDLRELNENRAAYECLSCMLVNYDKLFMVSEEIISQNRMSAVANFDVANLQELSSILSKGKGGWHDYVDSCLQVLLKEAKERYRGWESFSHTKGVDLAFKKISDGHPLRLWKVSTEVEAPPVELLNRLLRERHLWDNSVMKWKVVCRLDKQTEIFHHLHSSPSPHPNCDFCVLRSWRMDLPKGACALIETSVEHTEAEISSNSVRVVVLASRYLIEPCGSGKSRITHISRVDLRGRCPEWYNRAYGHISALVLVKLRNSFKHTRTEGPETKV